MKFIDLFCGIGAFRQGFKPHGTCVFSSEIDTAAASTYAANYGEHPHGDIKKIDPKDIPDHDLLLGGFPCFTEDTPVITKRGYIPIKDITTTDYVLTHTNNWRRVLHRMKTQKSEIYEIKCQGIPDYIKTTAEHPFYICKKEGNILSEPSFVEAKDLQVGDYVGYPLEEDNIDTDSHSEDFWYFIGKCISTARIKKDTVNVICDTDIIEKAGYTYITSDTVNSIYDLELCKLLNKFNTGLPSFIFTLSYNKQKALFLGWSNITNNKKLVCDFARLARNIFKCPVNIKKIRSKYMLKIDQKYRTGVVKNNIVWTKIKKIKITDKKLTDVYNLEVDIDNTYTVHGIAVHNCQPFSSAGKGLGFSDPRGDLFFNIYHILKEKQPRAVCLENVKGLMSNDRGNTLKTVIEHLEELGYHTSYKLLYATDFGLPTIRPRVFIVGSKDKKFNFSGLATHRSASLKEFLEPASLSWFKQYEIGYEESQNIIPSSIQPKIIYGTDRSSLKQDAGPGESKMQYDSAAILKNNVYGYYDPDDYILYASPRTSKYNITLNGYLVNRKSFKEAAQILSTEGYYLTLTKQTQSAPIYIPELNIVRDLTVREKYNIMGFPDNFKIHSVKTQALYQIGNSIAVNVSKALGNAMKSQGLI